MNHGKAELRRLLRARRDAFVADLDASTRQRLTEDALGRAEDQFCDARCIAAYFPFGSEIDIAAVLDRVSDRGRQSALPHVAGLGERMRFLAWRPGEPLEPGLFGLRQPAPDSPEVEPDLIFAPLLGFDRALARIGQGAGFYDRAFAALPAARRIGVAWSVQEVAEIPADPWDVPLHAVITERELIQGVC